MAVKNCNLSIQNALTAALLGAACLSGTSAWGAPWGSPNIVPVNPNDCLILVEDQAIIQGRIYVPGDATQAAPLRSDVCAGNRIVAGGKGTTEIPQGGGQKDAALIAPNIEIGNYANVYEAIYDGIGGSLNVGGSPTITQPTIQNPSLNPANFPSLPPFPAIVSNNDHKDAPNGSVLDLPPNTYGKLTIGKKAVVNLTGSGTYIFEHIATTNGCVLNPQAPDITVEVRDFARFAENCEVNPSQQEGFVLLVGGADGSYGGANDNRPGVYGERAAFGYDGDGSFYACLVFADQGTMNLRGILGTAAKPGAARFVGKSFQQVQALNIFLANPQEICGIEPQCACIESIACDSGTGTVTVKGLNFSELSVKSLAVFKEVGSISLLPPVSGDAGADQDVADLTIVDPTTFNTNNNLISEILTSGSGGAGNYYLGIVGPQTLAGAQKGLCVNTSQRLKVAADGCEILEP